MRLLWVVEGTEGIFYQYQCYCHLSLFVQFLINSLISSSLFRRYFTQVFAHRPIIQPIPLGWPWQLLRMIFKTDCDGVNCVPFHCIHDIPWLHPHYVPYCCAEGKWTVVVLVRRLATIQLAEIYVMTEELLSMNNSPHFSLLCLPLIKPCQVSLITVLEKQ